MIALTLCLFAPIYDVSWDVQGDKWESLKLFCVFVFVMFLFLYLHLKYGKYGSGTYLMGAVNGSLLKEGVSSINKPFSH